MKKHEELPEEVIEEAEERPAAHAHGGIDDEDALVEHLRQPHGLDAPEDLSRQTLEGLHDRLHRESDAADR